MGKTTSKKNTSKNVGGRPRKLVKVDYELVYKFARLGLTDAEIADLLSVSRQTLSENKKRDQRFLDTIKRGKLEADAEVVKSTYESALGGNVTAQIFWLKNRRPSQWRDKHGFEHEHKGNIIIKVSRLADRVE